MTPMEALHDEGQSLWLDHLSRDLLRHDGPGGARATGVASNLGALRREIEHGSAYDRALRRSTSERASAEDGLVALAVEDAIFAADALRPVWDRTDGVDGWTSLPLPPAAWRSPAAARALAAEMRKRADRPNLFLEIPGTADGIAAVEEALFEGIAVNVTMLCSARQYRAAADAYLRALERRAAAQLDLRIGSIASMSLSAWDAAATGVRPVEGAAVAIGRQVYCAYRTLLRSPRWQRLLNAGARPQRLLWTAIKADPACEFLTARALAAPFTINVLSPDSLRRFAAGGWLYSVGSAAPRGTDGALARLAASGINVEEVARRLQQDAMAAARTSWSAVVAAIEAKGAALRQAS